MEKTIQIFTTILAVFFLSTSASALTNIGFQNTTVQQNSLRINDTLRINTFVFNYDTASFSGNLAFGLSINGFIAQQAYVEVDTSTFTLAPNSGRQMLLNVKIVTPEFIVGPNVVIIWPITSRPAHDSIKTTIYIKYPDGIQNTLADLDFLSIGFKKNEAIISNLEKIKTLKQVRIFDILGKQIFESNDNFQKNIPFDNYNAGLYFFEFVTTNNQRKVIKAFYP